MAALAIALFVCAAATVLWHIRWAERHSDEETTFNSKKGLTADWPHTEGQEMPTLQTHKLASVAPRLIIALPY
jgi:hypothetical protein